MTRSVTHLFDDYGQAKNALAALERAGFSSSEVSLVSRYRDDGTLADDASGAAKGATVGALAGGGTGILAALGVIAIPGIGPLVAAGVLATHTCRCRWRYARWRIGWRPDGQWRQ
jgi:hypothetical protein